MPSHGARRTTRPPWWAGALLALVAVLAAEAFALLLPADAQPFHRAGFLVVLAAVIAAAWRGGLRGGLAAGAVGVLGIAHLFLVFGGPLGPPPVRLMVGGTIGLFGLVLAALIGHLRDRELRAVDALVREREAAAEREGRRFGIGRLFEAVGEAVVVTDGAGRVVTWNPAAERIFGYGRGEALGMEVAKLFPDADDAERFAQARGAEATRDRLAVLTLSARRRDGGVLVVETTLSRVDDALPHEGAGPFALAILRDVTERERLTRELEASNRALRDFTHVVAHDLRNPVRGLGMLIGFIERDAAPRLTPEGQEELAFARREADRLSLLLESLLDYSRVTNFDLSDLRAVDVAQTLASDVCRTRFDALLRERGARLEPPAQGAPPVRANEGALALVLGNLVANAITHNGKPAPRVEVRVRAREGGVEVSVHDDGPGFSSESLACVQDAVAGRESARGLGRSGFGIVLVHRAVDRMGGRVSFGASDLGGAAVAITLAAA